MEIQKGTGGKCYIYRRKSRGRGISVGPNHKVGYGKRQSSQEIVCSEQDRIRSSTSGNNAVERGKTKKDQKWPEKNKTDKEYRLEWEGDKKEDYVRKMEEWGEQLEEGVTEVQIRWERIVGTIWEVGDELGMAREFRKDNWEENNGDIKTQKRKACEALKKWARTRKEGGRGIYG